MADLAGSVAEIRRGAEDHLLAANVRDELFTLIQRKVAPADDARLQRPIHCGGLIRSERDARARIGLVTHGADSQYVLACRQILNAIGAVLLRQHVDGDLRLRVLR